MTTDLMEMAGTTSPVVSTKLVADQPMSRADIEREAERLAGGWSEYNDDPTPGRLHTVGRGARTPVPAWSGITWDVYVPPKAPKSAVAKQWKLPRGNVRRGVNDSSSWDVYANDVGTAPHSPYQLRKDVKALGMDGLTSDELERALKDGRLLTDDSDRRYWRGLEPNKCWESFTRAPINARPEDWDNDGRQADDEVSRPGKSGD
ncbi:hypothetical protein A5735_12290 [Mycolicibacter heraklionensis]|nr:hypothetical protein A5735_12290 [Mycolicibacter heraklionensis]